jgi:hypothetical protein
MQRRIAVIEIQISGLMPDYEDAIFWEWRNVNTGEIDIALAGAPTKDMEEMIAYLRDFVQELDEITIIGNSIFATSSPFSNGNPHVVEYRPVPDSIRQGLIEMARRRAREDLIAWAALEHERLTGVVKQLIDVPKEDE